MTVIRRMRSRGRRVSKKPKTYKWGTYKPTKTNIYVDPSKGHDKRFYIVEKGKRKHFMAIHNIGLHLDKKHKVKH